MTKLPCCICNGVYLRLLVFEFRGRHSRRHPRDTGCAGYKWVEISVYRQEHTPV